MEKIYVKNQFAIAVKNGKNDVNGNSKIEISIYAKYGQKQEFDCINGLINSKKLIKYRYSKSKNCFSCYFYRFTEETIEDIFNAIKDVFK